MSKNAPPAPNRLAIMREAKGLLLEDIAERVGVATSTVQRWEKHSIAIPSHRFEAIAAVYGCTVDDIFRQEGPGSPIQSAQVLNIFARIRDDLKPVALRALAGFADEVEGERNAG